MAAKISEKAALFQANLESNRLLISALKLHEQLTLLTAISVNSHEYEADHSMAGDVVALAEKLSQASSRAIALALFEGVNVKRQD